MDPVGLTGFCKRRMTMSHVNKCSTDEQRNVMKIGLLLITPSDWFSARKHDSETHQ
jgi:hypothetical protein